MAATEENWQTEIVREQPEERGSQRLRYSVREFEGPLEKLLELIRENKINIYDIPIAQITEQFLEYLDYAATIELGDLSEFYRMAAILLRIKSNMMLPVEVAENLDFDDPREELVEMLIEYQKFKQLSNLMEAKEDENEWTFERKKIQRVLPFDEEDLWERVDTWDLLQQMQKIFRAMISSYTDSRVLDMYEEVTEDEKITLMNEYLDKNGECMFTDLITRKGNQMDVICAFLAILVAVKFKDITIFQNRMFGDIKICRRQVA